MKLRVGGMIRVLFDCCVPIEVNFPGMEVKKLGGRGREHRELIYVSAAVVFELPRCCHFD